MEKRLSKHKKTIFSENLGGHGPFGPPWLRLWTRLTVSYPDHMMKEQTRLFFKVQYHQHQSIDCYSLNIAWHFNVW